MTKPLYIPPTKRHKGLKTWCKKCHENVLEVCKTTSKSLVNCPFGDKHKFKVQVHVPGTKDGKRTKNLTTRDLNEAIKQAIDFEKIIKEGHQIPEIPSDSSPTGPIISNSQLKKGPVLFAEALAKYVAYLHGEGVPEHKKKPRGTSYLGDIKNSYRYLGDCIKDNGHNLNTFTVYEFLNENIVGEIFEYLEKDIKKEMFSSSTFNKRIQYYKAFEVWLNTELKYPLNNLFNDVTRKVVTLNPKAINEEEFELLMNEITPENGVEFKSWDNKKKINHYKPWLKDAMKVALAMGGRRDEIVNLKFNSIIEKKGIASILEYENVKVNKIRGITDPKNKVFIRYPISKEFINLLNELNYAQYKGTDRYLIAPEITDENKRKGFLNYMTKAFTHYFKRLNTGRDLTFKSMRKANVTTLRIKGGTDKGTVFHPGKGGEELESRHYVDKNIENESKNGFSVFPKKSNDEI